jgi:hypothetical protein
VQQSYTSAAAGGEPAATAAAAAAIAAFVVDSTRRLHNVQRTAWLCGAANSQSAALRATLARGLTAALTHLRVDDASVLQLLPLLLGADRKLERNALPSSLQAALDQCAAVGVRWKAVVLRAIDLRGQINEEVREC